MLHKKIRFTIILCLLAYLSFGQSPIDVVGLELWLRADSVSYSDSQFRWFDKSGNNRDALQPNPAKAPQLNTSSQLENRPFLEFDGIDDAALIDSSCIVGTAFVVLSHQQETGVFPNYDGAITGQSGPNNRILFIGLGNTSNIYTSGLFTTNIDVNESGSTDFSPIENWKFIKGQTNSPSFFDNFIIGNDRGIIARSWFGGISEIIIFSSVLNPDEIEIVESYFYERYTPLIGLQDEITQTNFCPIKIGIGAGFISYFWDNSIESDSLTVSETGIHTVEVKSSFGLVIRDTVQVTFPGNFINSFSLCSGSDSLYTTNLESFDVTWQDGSTNSNYLIQTPSDYYLTVTDNSGCTYESDTVTVTEDFFPTEVELNENPNFCLGNDLFLSSGFAEAEAYMWNTGADTPFIQPQTSGEYWVEATNANGCIGRDTINVDIVGTAPYVEFTTGTACEDNAVIFTDNTFPEGATITSQDWTFPFEWPQGPDTLTGSVVETTFPATGSYPVELTVTLDNGCTGTGRDTVVVNPLPLVGFNYDAVTPCRGNAVAFESQSGVPGNGSIASYAWTFGNGDTDTGIVGSTTYEEIGTNTVQLAVTTTKGCVDSLLANVVVLGSPVADFDFEDVCVGLPVVFHENVNTDESGPVFYNWQFGDGYFSNFPNTSHVYAAAGVYDVQLTATGNDFGSAGCMDKTVKEVRVYAKPTGTIATTDGCLGAGVEFTDMTVPVVAGDEADPVVNRSWILPFGSGQGPVTVGSDSVVVWMPEAAGVYAVKLDFETEAGCSGTASGSVEVLDIPESAFSIDVPEEMPPLVVVPVNMSSGAEGYSWLLDGDVVSNAFEPELLFPDTGVYTVGLAAVNSLGCNDTSFQAVTVISPVYDIALLDIRYVISGDRLLLKALLGNKGNVGVKDFRVDVQLGLSANVRSKEVFDIAPGEVKEFVLGQDYEYLASRDLPYVCMGVKLVVDGGVVEEEDMDNNYMCVGLEKEKVVFVDPYPNPGSGEVNLGFVLPAAGDVELRVVDGMGKEVGRYAWDLKKGYSLEQVDVSGYAEGVYLLRYSYSGETVVKKLVVTQRK